MVSTGSLLGSVHLPCYAIRARLAALTSGLPVVACGMLLLVDPQAPNLPPTCVLTRRSWKTAKNLARRLVAPKAASTAAAC